MKKLLFCLSCFFTIAAWGQADSADKIKAFDFINAALNTGDYSFEVNDVVLPPEYVAIAQKYQQAIAANKEWFEAYFNQHYKEGEGLPYHENLGISKAEYEKLKTMDTAQKQLKVITEQPVRVNKDGATLSFTGKGEFKLLDLI